MSLFNNKPTPARLHKKVSWREKYGVFSMITYDQQNKFYNHALKIVEKMGGDISAHGRWQGGVFLSVSVNHDSTYEKIRSIMDKLHGLYGGEIQYYKYWKSEGFIPQSQASLENIDENKVLEIIKED